MVANRYFGADLQHPTVADPEIDRLFTERLVLGADRGFRRRQSALIDEAAGALAVGIAGGAVKCRFAIDELGFDACVDHRSETFAADFKAALPNGIDGYFENVGGKSFTLASRRLNDFARVAICGLIASYEGAETSSLDDLRILLVKRAKIEGFIVSDHLPLWPQALGELAGAVATGKLKWRETVADGIQAAPAAFFGMLRGKNFGKQLVKLI